MSELVVTLAIAAVLIGSAILTSRLAWETVLGAGLWMTLLGLVGGVPAGLWYHVRLYRSLSGAAPRRWWWRPTTLHGRLGAADRRRVMPWFYLGAAGFLLALAGCVLVAIGVLRSR